jgi:hypothetical protein
MIASSKFILSTVVSVAMKAREIKEKKAIKKWP